jgi:hypothetical protein
MMKKKWPTRPPCQYCGLYGHDYHCGDCGATVSDDKCARCQAPTTLQEMPAAEVSGDWFELPWPAS